MIKLNNSLSNRSTKQSRYFTLSNNLQIADFVTFISECFFVNSLHFYHKELRSSLILKRMSIETHTHTSIYLLLRLDIQFSLRNSKLILFPTIAIGSLVHMTIQPAIRMWLNMKAKSHSCKLHFITLQYYKSYYNATTLNYYCGCYNFLYYYSSHLSC